MPASAVRLDGDWWVLLVTDGLSVEFPPELYRDHDDAEREAERWARVLSARSRATVDRPFPDRLEVGDEWIRLVTSFLPEESNEIWVGTYWARDGSPDPEAELFPDASEAIGWFASRQPAPSSWSPTTVHRRLRRDTAFKVGRKRPRSTAPRSCCERDRASRPP